MRAGHRRPGARVSGHAGPQRRDGGACVQVRSSSGDINSIHLLSHHATSAAANIDLRVTSALIITVIYGFTLQNTAIHLCTLFVGMHLADYTLILCVCLVSVLREAV